MNMEATIETTNKLLKLRSVLDRINQVSFSYYTINKKFRMDSLNEEQCNEIIRTYQDLIQSTKDAVESY